MVEVEVSVNDDVNLIGRNPGLLETIQQARLVLVDGLAFLAELAADAGLDEDVLLAGAEQQGIERQRNGVALVRLDAFFPHDLGNDAEHGAAVHAIGAVGKDGEFKVAQRDSVHRFVSTGKLTFRSY